MYSGPPASMSGRKMRTAAAFPVLCGIKDPGCKDTGDFQRWQKLLSKGTLVTISGSSAEPREVDLFAG